MLEREKQPPQIVLCSSYIHTVACMWVPPTHVLQYKKATILGAGMMAEQVKALVTQA